MLNVCRMITHHIGRRTTKLTGMRRKCTQWHLAQGGRDKGSIRIAINLAMIDAKNSRLAVEECVWAWIARTFDDILSEYDISAR